MKQIKLTIPKCLEDNKEVIKLTNKFNKIQDKKIELNNKYKLIYEEDL